MLGARKVEGGMFELLFVEREGADAEETIRAGDCGEIGLWWEVD